MRRRANTLPTPFQVFPCPLRAARGKGTLEAEQRAGDKGTLEAEQGAGVVPQPAPILTFPRKRGKGPGDVAASKYTPSLARSAGEGWGGGGGCGIAARPHPDLPPQAGEGTQ